MGGYTSEEEVRRGDSFLVALFIVLHGRLAIGYGLGFSAFEFRFCGCFVFFNEQFMCNVFFLCFLCSSRALRCCGKNGLSYVGCPGEETGRKKGKKKTEISIERR